METDTDVDRLDERQTDSDDEQIGQQGSFSAAEAAQASNVWNLRTRTVERLETDPTCRTRIVPGWPAKSRSHSTPPPGLTAGIKPEVRQPVTHRQCWSNEIADAE